MLQLIRDRAQGIIIWLIVGLIIITFALFGLSGYFSGASTSVVATVNGVDITESEFLREYQNTQQRLQRMLGKNFNSSMFPEQMLKQRTLESMIQRELLNQELDQGGFHVASEQIYKTMESIPAFHDENGKFSRERYQEVLQSQRMSAASFEVRLANDIANQHLQSGLTESTLVTDKQIGYIQKLQNQQRKVGYFSLPLNQYREKIKITQQDIQDYYDKHKTEYKTPEKVSVEYIELKLADISQQFDVSDEDISNYYQQHMDAFTTRQEQRKVRHILVKVDSSTDDKTAREKAKKIVARINNGEDFAELAKTESDDTFSAKNGGGLGLSTRKDMDKVLGDVAFGLEKGAISAPVLSNFGYHIVKVDEIIAAVITPLDKAKAQIRRDMQNERADDRYHTQMSKLDNLGFESPDSLADVAEQMSLPLKQSPLFSRTSGSGLFANRKIVDSVFSDEVLTGHRNSELIELSDTEAVMLRLRDHQAASVKPLEQVSRLIEAHLKAERATQQAEADADSARDMMKQGTAPQSVASKFGANWIDAGYVSRKPGKGDKLDNMLRDKVFRLAHPAEGKPVFTTADRSNGDVAVIALYEVKQGEKTTEKASEAAERQRMNSLYGQVEYAAFIDFLEKKTSISRKLTSAEDENN